MPELLTTREAAARLRSTSRAFMAFARKHGIPPVPVRSRVVLWDVADIDRAIEEAKLGTTGGRRPRVVSFRRSGLSAAERLARSVARVTSGG